MAEKKPQKEPLQSPTGIQMEDVITKLTMHKSQMATQDQLNKMRATMNGEQPEGGSIKQAFFLGMKLAEDSVADNTSEDNPDYDNPDESEEEALISQMRRGWPEPKHMRDKDGDEVETEEGGDHFYDRNSIKERAQTTKYSPETTA